MCQEAVKHIVLCKPMLAWKMILSNGKGPYYPSYSLHGQYISSFGTPVCDVTWTSGRVMRAAPKESETNITMAGFHVFLHESAAIQYMSEYSYSSYSIYQAGFYEPRVIPVLCWGDAIVFRWRPAHSGGVRYGLAVEFATSEVGVSCSGSGSPLQELLQKEGAI
jgi:hypothetical protein